MISAFYICDGKADCQNKADEKYCHLIDSLFYPSQICEAMFLAKVNAFVWACPWSIEKRKTELSCNHLLQNIDPMTFNFIEPYYEEATTHTSGQCVYEPNECGLPEGINKEEHFLSCESYNCTNRYFACPYYYCLPWRFVCNGRWECPGGTDEMLCERTECPGMFKCKDSTICISVESMCDTVIDCHFGDDEHFCLKNYDSYSCPPKCACYWCV